MASRRVNIVLFGETLDWHTRQLLAAFRVRGMCAKRVSLRDCAVDTAAPSGLSIPGFEDSLPAAAFVRGTPAGTFEQTTMRLGILHALRELGVLVWNDARAIEACIDKSMTSHLLAKAGLPAPATVAVQSHEAAARLAARTLATGKRLVWKPLFGAQGKGLKLIARVEDLPSEEEAAGVYYLQEFVDTGAAAHDFRVLVSAGRAVAGMMRVARKGEWITNIKQGGTPQRLLMNEEISALAVAAATVTGARYAGVDLIADAGTGTAMALEVNSMPAWRGLQSVTPGIAIAETIVADFAGAIGEYAANAAMLAKQTAV